MLKLSKKADYALMALQYMGSVQYSDLSKARVVNTKEIAEENNIPVELLAKVLQALAKQEIIESHNGPKGGYILAVNRETLPLPRSWKPSKDPLGIADCYHENDHSPCEQLEHCNIRTPLLKVQESIYQLLSSMTIEDMMSGPPLIIVESRKTEGVQFMKLPIYMDNHSTTACDPRVVEAMLPFFTEKFGNSASRNHTFGWEAEEGVDAARKQIAKIIHADAKEIVFTSGATESDNLALKGVVEMYREKGDHIITSSTEHRAVIDTAKAWKRRESRSPTFPLIKPGWSARTM